MVAQHSGHAGVGKRTSDETRTAQRVMMLSSCAVSHTPTKTVTTTTTTTTTITTTTKLDR